MVGAAKPGLTRALDPVVLALRDHDVRVRVVLLSIAVQARMDRQAVGEALLRRYLVREVADEGNLIVRIESSRQCEIGADVQPAVRPFVQVGRVPILARIVLCPGWHVARFDVDRRVAIGVGVLITTRDVGMRSDGARAAGSRAGSEGEVVAATASRCPPAGR